MGLLEISLVQPINVVWYSKGLVNVEVGIPVVIRLKTSRKEEQQPINPTKSNPHNVYLTTLVRTYTENYVYRV